MGSGTCRIGIRWMAVRAMTHRIRVRGWGPVLWVLCAALVVLLASASAASAEPSQPTIDSTAAREASPTSVVVEAQINPKGSAGLYQFNLIAQSRCLVDQGEWIEGERVERGGVDSAATSFWAVLEAASSDVTVSHTFTGLTPDHVYWYSVYAGSPAGGEVGTEVPRSVGLGCVDHFPEGSVPKNMPYVGRVTLVSLFSAEEMAQRVWQAAEEERQRTAAREHEERQTREAAERAEEEALRRAASSGTSHCVVPSVIGDDLPEAHRLITRAHCVLGRIRRRHASGHRRQVVVAQSPRHGRLASPGAKVAITLGSARTRR